MAGDFVVIDFIHPQEYRYMVLNPTLRSPSFIFRVIADLLAYTTLAIAETLS